MKVFRNRIRVLIIVLCALAGVIMGTGLTIPSALRPAAELRSFEATVTANFSETATKRGSL
jgi:hypothetical protein